MPGTHDRIIADAAKAALEPLGFRRKGRSRTWLADHGWWLTVVEFQPSAWSKGCYLNVAAHWLWSEIGTLSFDFGGRIAEHVEYVSDSQFTPAAAHLAESAAVEAQRLTETFDSLSKAAEVLLEEAQTKNRHPHLHPGWSNYNAGMAAALVERPDEARRMFTHILASPAPPGSVLHRAAERMAQLLSRPIELREEVVSLIKRQREALRLPPLTRPAF
uniref:DUF4304 domain-containing protein n=1 Tax=uncultured Sphingomonas sp. TaxID=158754 RepID=UPI0025FD0395|nr:DUF4304 domain-containing protein [uncultured Sphingomonas sp.]